MTQPAPAPSATPEKPPRKPRGPWFGALVILGVLVGIPLLVGLGVYIYVKGGFLESKVNRSLQETFGSGAKISGLETKSIDGAKADGVVLPAPSGEAMLTTGAVEVNWEPLALIRQSHIRSVHISKPVVTLHQNSDLSWNFSSLLNTPSSGDTKVKIDQIQLEDGTVNLSLDGKAPLQLVQVQGTVLLLEPPLAKSISIQARGPFGQPITVELRKGPGSAVYAHTQSGLDLAKDLAVFLPTLKAQGQTRFEVTVSREDQKPGATEPMPIALDTDLKFDALKIPITQGLTFAAPHAEAKIQASLSPGADGVITANALLLHIPELAHLEGQVKYDPKNQSVAFNQGSLRFDVSDVRKYFTPDPLKPEIQVVGKLDLTNLAVKYALDGKTPLSVAGDLRAAPLHVTIPGMGELPPLNLTAGIDWPGTSFKLTRLDVGMEPLGKVSVSGQWPALPTQLPMIELLNGLEIKTIDLDLSRALETEWGRRLAAQRWSKTENAPSLSELPWHAAGRLKAENLKLKPTANADGSQTYALEGLELQGLEILKWPLSAPLPGEKIDGKFSAQLGVKGEKIQTLDAAAQISMGRDAAEQVKSTFNLKAVADAKGNLVPQRLELPTLSLPLEKVPVLLGAKLPGWIKLMGRIDAGNSAWDFAQNKALSDVTIKEVGLDARTDLLGMAIPLGGLRNLNGTAHIEYGDGALSLKASLKKFLFSIASLSEKFQECPASDTLIKLDAPQPGKPQHISAEFKWDSDKKITAQCWLSPLDAKTGKQRIKGNFDTNLWGGLGGEWDCALDLERGLIEPLTVTLKTVDITILRREFPEWPWPKNWNVRGHLKEITLELNRVFYQRLMDQPWNGKISAIFQNVTVAHPGSDSQAEKLAGKFSANFDYDEKDGTTTINSSARFTNYEALIEGSYYLPPPQAGENVDLRLVGQVNAREGQTWDVKLHKLECSLANLLTLSASAGTLHVPASGDVFGEGEGRVDVKCSAPDLAKVWARLGLPNLKDRFPWLEPLKVTGGAFYKGQQLWGKNEAAVQGELSLTQADLSYQLDRNITLKGLDGSIPLAFYKGTLWPGEWPKRSERTLSFSSVEYAPFTLSSQTLAFSSAPNQLSVSGSLEVAVPGGTATLNGLRCVDLLAPEPALTFGLDVKGIHLGQMLQRVNPNIHGFENMLLAGSFPQCAFYKQGGALGAWTLDTTGELSAPLLQGKLRLGGVQARGLFSSSPVWGTWVKGENLSLHYLTKSNPSLGSLNLNANVSLTNFSATGLELKDIQSFKVAVEGVPSAQNSFDGKLAILIAPSAVDDAIKGYPITKEDFATWTLVFQDMGLGFELNAGKLRGPLALPAKKIGNAIIKGLDLTGLKGLIYAARDINEPPNAESSWSDAVAKFNLYLKDNNAKKP